MYCSSCGVAVQQGLSYCNYCGASLSQGGPESNDIRPEALIFGIMGTFVFGMIAITVLMGVLKTVLDVPTDATVLAATLPFLLVVFLEIIFVRLLLRRSRSGET